MPLPRKSPRQGQRQGQRPNALYLRSPYKQKTVVMRVPLSLVPQVRKMLERCRSETARRRTKRPTKARSDLTPRVKTKPRPRR